MYRFYHNTKFPTDKKRGYLTLSEFNHALFKLVKAVQYYCFSEKIENISKSRSL